MKALITGASSGIGADMARILSSKGYDLILVARRKNKLEELSKELNTNIKLIPMDISILDNCYKLYNIVKNENIDILINNAGFGTFGMFLNVDLDTELNMIDLNIKSVHVLTKLFLKDFKKKDSGYILNVASSAAFMSGPLLSTYYATKSYVMRLTTALYEELRHNNSNVYVGVLCPGPVDTEFNSVAGVKFALKGLKSYDVANYAIKNMFKKKLLIIPGFSIKLGILATRLLPMKLMLKISYRIQRKKDQD